MELTRKSADAAHVSAQRKAVSSGIDILVRDDHFRNLVPGVHTLGGQGNTLAIETGRGVVLVDAGPGGAATRKMIDNLRAITDAPVHAIVYSHGHAGYNYGVRTWQEHALSRGDPPPLVIGHRNVAPRYRRYLETAPLQSWLHSRQFRREIKTASAGDYVMPDIAFDDTLVLDCDGRVIEMIHAASETDDTVAVWLPAERFLYGSAAMIRSIPNVGTPLRTLRDPLRWAATLDRLHALGPAMVLPEFGTPIRDAAEVEDAFVIPARALRYLRNEVVQRMNQGMSEREILRDMHYPPEIFGHPLMRPIYGAPEYIVRDVWRSESGWWDRNPTHLHPSAPGEVGLAIFDALGDAASVLTHARRLADAGQAQLAMHVLDVLVDGPRDHDHVRAARELKASLCRVRAAQCDSIVSRQLLCSSAEDLLGVPIGNTREQDPPFNFSWG